MLTRFSHRPDALRPKTGRDQRLSRLRLVSSLSPLAAGCWRRNGICTRLGRAGGIAQRGSHCEGSGTALRSRARPHCEDFLPHCGPLTTALRCRHRRSAVPSPPRTAAPLPPHCGGRGPHCDTRVRHARTALRGPSAAAWVAPTAWVAPPPLPTGNEATISPLLISRTCMWPLARTRAQQHQQELFAI